MKQQGMTLIEVLVGLFIISLAISIGYQNSTLFISTIERSKAQSLAKECAKKFINDSYHYAIKIDAQGSKNCSEILRNHFQNLSPQKLDDLTLYYKQTNTSFSGLFQFDVHVEQNSITLFHLRRLWADS